MAQEAYKKYTSITVGCTISNQFNFQHFHSVGRTTKWLEVLIKQFREIHS